MHRSRTPLSERAFQILVIDDNEGDARLFEEAWAECKVVEAKVATLKQSKDSIVYLRGLEPYANAALPDIVLLDYKMPVDGGIALTEIKGDPEYMHLPVIVFTGSVDRKDYFEAYQRGANCCYHKPDNLDDWMSLVNHLAEHWFVRAVLPRR
jgi:CheY-like chemotaxis protein